MKRMEKIKNNAVNIVRFSFVLDFGKNQMYSYVFWRS